MELIKVFSVVVIKSYSLSELSAFLLKNDLVKRYSLNFHKCFRFEKKHLSKISFLAILDFSGEKKLKLFKLKIGFFQCFQLGKNRLRSFMGISSFFNQHCNFDIFFTIMSLIMLQKLRFRNLSRG